MRATVSGRRRPFARSVTVLLASALSPMAQAAVPGPNTTTAAPANTTAPASPAAGGGLPREVSVSAALTKMIGDTILELRGFDQRDTTAEARTCATLARAARSDGWCGRSAFDVESPLRDKPGTLRLQIVAPSRVTGTGQVATGSLTARLESSCAAADAAAADKAAADGITVEVRPERGPCRVTLTAFAAEPGEYRATVRVRDATGGFDQSSTLTARAASGVWIALAYLMLGGGIGALLAFLRNGFRSRSATFGAALREAQRYDVAASLALGSQLVPPEREGLLGKEVAAYLADARAGRSTDLGGPKLVDRITALNAWAATAQRARALEAGNLAPLRGAFSTALSDVLEGQTPGARLPALAADLEAALDTQANGGNDTVAAAGLAQEMMEAVPPPDLNPLVLIGVQSLEQLSWRTFLAGLAETAATFVLFAVGALLVVWVDNAAWGTPRDVLNMILVGAGAFLGSAGIRGLKDEARI